MGIEAGRETASRAARMACIVLAATCLLLVGCSSDGSSTASGSAGHKRTATTTTAPTTTTTPSTGEEPSGSAASAEDAHSPTGATDAAAVKAAAAPHGNIDTPAAKVKDPGTLPAVALDKPVDTGERVTVRIASIQPVQADAKLPGETSGPAVQVVVEIANGSGRSVDLGNVGVVLTGAGGSPTARVTSPDVHPFSGQVAAGGTATGAYTFTIPVADRDDSRLTVKYSEAAPTAAFTGSLPRG